MKSTIKHSTVGMLVCQGWVSEMNCSWVLQWHTLEPLPLLQAPEWKTNCWRCASGEYGGLYYFLYTFERDLWTPTDISIMLECGCGFHSVAVNYRPAFSERESYSETGAKSQTVDQPMGKCRMLSLKRGWLDTRACGVEDKDKYWTWWSAFCFLWLLHELGAVAHVPISFLLRLTIKTKHFLQLRHYFVDTIFFLSNTVSCVEMFRKYQEHKIV